MLVLPGRMLPGKGNPLPTSEQVRGKRPERLTTQLPSRRERTEKLKLRNHSSPAFPAALSGGGARRSGLEELQPITKLRSQVRSDYSVTRGHAEIDQSSASSATDCQAADADFTLNQASGVAARLKGDPAEPALAPPDWRLRRERLRVKAAGSASALLPPGCGSSGTPTPMLPRPRR